MLGSVTLEEEMIKSLPEKYASSMIHTCSQVHEIVSMATDAVYGHKQVITSKERCYAP